MTKKKTFLFGFDVGCTHLFVLTQIVHFTLHKALNNKWLTGCFFLFIFYADKKKINLKQKKMRKAKQKKNTSLLFFDGVVSDEY